MTSSVHQRSLHALQAQLLEAWDIDSSALGTKNHRIGGTLPNCHIQQKFYRTVVDKPSTEISLLEWFLKAFIRWTNGVTIYNVLSDCQVKVTDRVTVQPWQMYGLRRLMAGGRFHVVLHIINSGGVGLIDLVLLKGYTPTVKAGMMANACAPQHLIIMLSEHSMCVNNCKMCLMFLSLYLLMLIVRRPVHYADAQHLCHELFISHLQCLFG